MKRKALPQGILNFPYDNPHARVMKSGGRVYAAERRFIKGDDGRWHEKRRLLGYIIDNSFISLEEYRHLYKRSGEKREDIPEERGTRTYTAEHVFTPRVNRRASCTVYPNPSEIQNYPLNDPEAKIIKIKNRNGFFVVHGKSYRENGRIRIKREYIGRIIDGVFYSSEEYRRTFRRDGSRRES